MENQIVSFVVIGCLAVTVLLALVAIRHKVAKRRAATATSANVEKWMAAQGYVPTRFAFFYSTAIAFRQGEQRLLLHRNGATKFCPLADISAIKAHETIERSRPLGAAPGIVELHAVTRFNLELSLKSSTTPLIILLENRELLTEWEHRLNELLTQRATSAAA